jgi:hypothetical protein
MDWSPVRIRWNSIYRKLLVTYVALTALGTSILAIYILWSFYRLCYEVEAGDLDAGVPRSARVWRMHSKENDLDRAKTDGPALCARESSTLRSLRLMVAYFPRPAQLDRQ